MFFEHDKQEEPCGMKLYKKDTSYEASSSAKGVTLGE